MKLRTVLLLLAVLAVVGALAWGAIRIVRATTATTALELPTTRVKHGRVTLTVACRGELQGGNSEMLTAPMIGGVFTSFLLELVVYPAVYEVWKWHGLRRQLAHS